MTIEFSNSLQANSITGSEQSFASNASFALVIKFTNICKIRCLSEVNLKLTSFDFRAILTLCFDSEPFVALLIGFLPDRQRAHRGFDPVAQMVWRLDVAVPFSGQLELAHWFYVERK